VAVVEALRLTLIDLGWEPKVSHRDLHAPY